MGTVQESGESAPDLSVVIVSWNVRDLLLDCLRALESPGVRGDLRLEVIVVDNASSDGSAARVRGLRSVRLIEAGTNLGYGRANNLGFAAARGKHLLVLNPDTVPCPGSLEALLSFLEAHPRAGIASPRLLNPDGSVQEGAFTFPTLLMAWLDLFPLPGFIPGRIRASVLKSRLNGRYPQEATAKMPYRIQHPLGASVLIRREAYEQVGGFDTAIRMYSEEVDLAMRYAAAGWECWQVPRARVIHLSGQSTRQVPERMYVELWRSRLYLYAKHYSSAHLWALRLLLSAAQLRDLGGALLGRVTGDLSREEARRKWRRAGAVLRLVFAR